MSLDTASMSTLVILGLAAHRLWLLWLTQEIFRPVRERLSKIHPKVAYLLNCGICTSVWVGAGVGGTWSLDWPLRGLVWILALSEMIAIMESVMRMVDRFGRFEHRVLMQSTTAVATKTEKNGDLVRQ